VASGTKYRPDSAAEQKRPKYVKVKTHLFNQIQSGAFASGKALPRERDLAQSFAVATSTVRQALQELESEGLIRRVRGQGTFATTPEHRRSLKRSNLLTLIVPQVRDGLYPSLIHGFEQAITGTEYRITVANSCNEARRQEELIRRAITDNVAGVAIVPTTFPPMPPEQSRLLQDQFVPLVFCHRSVEDTRAPLVTWSGVTVGRMVAQTLLEQGHRRIATIVGFRDPMVIATAAGIQQAIAEFGLPPSAYCLRYHGERQPGTSTREALRHVLGELLNSSERPTAIHCGNLPAAEQVFLLANTMGFSVPKDLSLIYFGDSRLNGGLAQQLTCVAVDAQSIGYQAGELLEKMVAGQVPRDAAERIEMPLTLLPGETVCPPLTATETRSLAISPAMLADGVADANARS
jgi:GntR family transcriptional regulator, arabinose operon transcriptional repressor